MELIGIDQVPVNLVQPCQATYRETTIDNPSAHSLKRAAVLIPIVYDINHCQIVLTLRDSSLPHHAGQVSLPGGTHQKDTDNTMLDTALRETEEEIGLPISAVFHPVQLPEYTTTSGFRITPFLGLIKQKSTLKLKPNPGEVSEIFMVPLSNALNPARFRKHVYMKENMALHFYEMDYKHQRIWGATAGILLQMRLWLWQSLRSTA